MKLYSFSIKALVKDEPSNALQRFVLISCILFVGSPFMFEAYDIRKMIAGGNGLSSVQCNKMATFSIQTPDSVLLSDLNINITG